MSEDNPLSFPAMQDKFLKDLKFHISVAYDKSGYEHIGYPSLIKVLGDALEKAHELNVMEQARIAYEKELKNG